MWARSYTVRAVLSLLLLISFYVIALLIALFLLAVALVDLTARRIELRLVIVCLVGAAVILWSIFPRRAKFNPPGPRITPAEHPRLFSMVRDTATEIGVAAPHDVYLVPEVNAFVTQIGGLMGMGGRRIMALGVPLLASVNVSQLKAVIAHEFGHYAGGETRLAGVIYATRGAMIRTVQNLYSSGLRLFGLPFTWMFKAYMGITNSISRQQELVADNWAVRLAGVEAHTTMLREIGVHAAALEAFLKREVGPLASLNIAPTNYFEGYRRYLDSTEFSRLRPLSRSSSCKTAGSWMSVHWWRTSSPAAPRWMRL